MNYSLIIPIYNEYKTLPILFNKLNKIGKNIEIIIVDDGSNDGTKEYLNKHNLFLVVTNELNLGKGASIKRGLEIASRDNIILIDGDLEVEICEIPTLIDIYKKGDIDVLLGKRWDKYQALGLNINSIGNFFINSLFNLLFKSNFNDVLCCVKILNKNDLKSFDLKSNGFSIEIETMAKIVEKKLKTKEKSIKYIRRTAQDGKKLKVTDSWSIILKMITMKFLRKNV
jgi:glycosyltransferase involved in cell wall biosynthesis